MRELTFLSKIKAATELRNQEKQKSNSLESLKALAHNSGPSEGLFESALTSSKHPKIIAEIKRKSPSQGTLIGAIDASVLAQSYLEAGASAVSILTEPTSFGGSLDDLTQARKSNAQLAILQKDFIIDAYQIYEAKALGASAFLLIVAMLDEEKLRAFKSLAATLGLAVLVEVHSLEELEIALKIESRIIGVNNRDLHSLQISLDTSRELIKLIPDNVISVSESGISSPDEIKELHALGFDAFLIGSSFMRTADPAKQLQSFMQELRS